MKDNCYPAGLMTVDDAIDKILSLTAEPTETVELAITDAPGYVIAEAVHSDIDVPGHDNTAMDGYAVRTDEITERGISLPISQRIPAGSVCQPLQPGTAARIFTGARIPEGADAVVMQEQCEESDGTVTIDADVVSGQNIRRAGEDITKGKMILDKGKMIRPQEQGLLASIGIQQVTVYRRLKVAIFFTGDELVEPGKELQVGQIYNSNRYTLRGLLQSFGCEVVDHGIVKDDLQATKEVLNKASRDADLVITSGGVSVGEEDYVRTALDELGEVSLWRVAMKPGKPVAYGKVDGKPFIGLPGNPVSVFVTFLLFARPFLRKMQGIDDTKLKPYLLESDFEFTTGNRQEYLRARIEDGKVTIYPHQGSGVLSSASWADGLVEVKADTSIKRGELVRYIPFGDLGI